MAICGGGSLPLTTIEYLTLFIQTPPIFDLFGYNREVFGHITEEIIAKI